MVAPAVAFAGKMALDVGMQVAGQTLSHGVSHVRKLAQGGYKEYTGSEALVGKPQVADYMPYDFGNISPGGQNLGINFNRSYRPGRGFRQEQPVAADNTRPPQPYGMKFGGPGAGLARVSYPNATVLPSATGEIARRSAINVTSRTAGTRAVGSGMRALSRVL